MNSVVEFPLLKRACQDCAQKRLCFAVELNDEEFKEFKLLTKRRYLAGRGEYLFHQGDAHKALYLVRSGSLKVSTLNQDGKEQVLGFYLPGEMLGLDGVQTGSHICTALTLETTTVCELSWQPLSGSLLPGLQKQMTNFYSREIARDYALLCLLGCKSAEQKLARFLLELAARFAERGLSAKEFNLHMSRQDIANYLGLVIETVSRLFARLQESGVLAVDRRRIKLLDSSRLQCLAGLGSGATAINHRAAQKSVVSGAQSH